MPTRVAIGCLLTNNQQESRINLLFSLAVLTTQQSPRRRQDSGKVTRPRGSPGQADPRQPLSHVLILPQSIQTNILPAGLFGRGNRRFLWTYSDAG
jgi:hypothetical protein